MANIFQIRGESGRKAYSNLQNYQGKGETRQLPEMLDYMCPEPEK